MEHEAQWVQLGCCHGDRRPTLFATSPPLGSCVYSTFFFYFHRATCQSDAQTITIDCALDARTHTLPPFALSDWRNLSLVHSSHQNLHFNISRLLVIILLRGWNLCNRFCYWIFFLEFFSCIRAHVLMACESQRRTCIITPISKAIERKNLFTLIQAREQRDRFISFHVINFWLETVAEEFISSWCWFCNWIRKMKTHFFI